MSPDSNFEFARRHLVDHDPDLSALRARYINDAGGAPAFDPAVLLKIVLPAYSCGVVSGKAQRIISLRRASRRELKHYVEDPEASSICHS